MKNKGVHVKNKIKQRDVYEKQGPAEETRVMDRKNRCICVKNRLTLKENRGRLMKKGAGK
jgi:hypothetical protein